MQMESESRYYIVLPSGKYYVNGENDDITETRLVDFAEGYNEKNRAVEELKHLEKGSRIVKFTRTPVNNDVDKNQPNDTNNEKKYVVGNLGDWYTMGGKPAYMFDDGFHGRANYLYGVKLISLEKAKKLSNKLEKEGLVEHKRREKWAIIEIETTEEEVAL